MTRPLSGALRRKVVRDLGDAHGWWCHYCAVDLTPTGATLDHIWPRSLGGRNMPWNFVLACQGCNGRHGAQLLKCSCRRCCRAIRMGATGIVLTPARHAF